MTREKNEITKKDVREALDAYSAACRKNKSFLSFVVRVPEHIKQLEDFATPKKINTGWRSVHIPFFSREKAEPGEKQGLLAKRETQPNNLFTQDEWIALITLLITIRFDSQLTDVGAELSRCFDGEDLLLAKALGNDWQNKLLCIEQLKRCGLMNYMNILTVSKAPSFPRELGQTLKTNTDNGNCADQDDFNSLLTKYGLINPVNPATKMFIQ